MSEQALTLRSGVPAIVDADGHARRTTAPQLFETGSGEYIAYADDWADQLKAIYPTDLELEAAKAVAIEKYGLPGKPGDRPSIFLLVAMTLEEHLEDDVASSDTL